MNKGHVKIESRKFIRLHIMLNINYRVLTASKIKGITLSKDIGLGGINIFVTEKIGKNTPVELDMQLQDNPDLIKVKGNIVWQNEVFYEGKKGKRYYLTGIQFNKLEALDKIRLFGFITSNLKYYSEIEDKKVIDKIEEMYSFNQIS